MHWITSRVSIVWKANAASFLQRCLVCSYETTFVRFLKSLMHINPLALELDIYSLAHHLCKVWIFYEPRRVHSLVFSLEGRAWPSHVTGMALALHPGQVLGGSLPLLSPAFRRSHFSRQVPPSATTWEILAAKGGTVGEKDARRVTLGNTRHFVEE